MLIELLSPSNYISYNIKVAEILGLHPAIYLSELMNINDKAIRKDKVNDSSFILDRDYVSKRTTLSVDEQLDVESNLIKLGIVDKPNDDKDCIVLNINVLTSLMMSADEELIGTVKKLSKGKGEKKTRVTKSDAIRQNLKANITTTNMELIEAYSDWIDSVFSKEGWMSKKAVLMGQTVVDDFSKRDLDVALQLISIASIHGYRDMNWAVNKYKEQHKFRIEVSQNQITNPQKVGLSKEVF
jgi:hypothetical protein